MNFEFSAFSEKIPMIKNYLCMFYVLFIVSPVNLQCIFGKLVRKGTVKINIPSTPLGQSRTHTSLTDSFTSVPFQKVVVAILAIIYLY